jgi:carbon storage regulator
VIRRRPGESVLIGDGIELEILDCGHSHVKLGIRAPRDVVILRKEVRIAGEQNREAAREVPAEQIARLRSLFPA